MLKVKQDMYRRKNTAITMPMIKSTIEPTVPPTVADRSFESDISTEKYIIKMFYFFWIACLSYIKISLTQICGHHFIFLCHKYPFIPGILFNMYMHLVYSFLHYHNPFDNSHQIGHRSRWYSVDYIGIDNFHHRTGCILFKKDTCLINYFVAISPRKYNDETPLKYNYW